MKGIDTCTIEERATEIGGRVNEITNDLRVKAETVKREATRNFRRAQGKAEEMLEEGRHEIKTHPLTAVAAFAGAGLLVGFLAGLFAGSRKRD